MGTQWFQFWLNFNFLDWLRWWCKFSGPIPEQSKGKPKQIRITFNTQLTAALMKPYPRSMVNHYTSNFRVIHLKKVGGNTVTNLQVIVMVNLLHSANLAKSLKVKQRDSVWLMKCRLSLSNITKQCKMPLTNQNTNDSFTNINEPSHKVPKEPRGLQHQLHP